MRMGGLKGKNQRTAFLLKLFYFLVIPGLILVLVAASILWYRIFAPNVITGSEGIVDFYIPTGSDMHDVLDLLEENGLVRKRSTLEWVAARKNYLNNVHPGRFRIREGMNNNELVNILRSGSQAPVNLVFISQRTVHDIASVVSGQIEADSADIADLASDEEFIRSLGFDREGIPALLIPNTYQFYWNTSAEGFFRRMKIEYEKFWNQERENRRQALGLDRLQVSTLASIVSEETVKHEEMPVIAGVYLNRLRRGMRLQADPTIKFAIGDFTVNRILSVHLNADSPYNTYKYAGLPPGPIIIPPVQAIDAVLDADEHDYLYFCAREDFSGYHRFARTLAEHNRNARLYQDALNRRRVFR